MAKLTENELFIAECLPYVVAILSRFLSAFILWIGWNCFAPEQEVLNYWQSLAVIYVLYVIAGIFKSK